MSLPALLDELDRRGITVETRPHGNISVRPWKAAPPELRERLSAEKPALSAYLLARELALQAEREELDLIQYVGAAAPDLLDIPELAPNISPAASIIATCGRLDIALRLTADGRLALGRSDLCGNEPTIPQSLAMAVEAHATDISRLFGGTKGESTTMKDAETQKRDPKTMAPCAPCRRILCKDCVDDHIQECTERAWHRWNDPYGWALE